MSIPIIVMLRTHLSGFAGSLTVVNRASHLGIVYLCLSGCVASSVEIPSWDHLTPATVDIQKPIRLPEIPSPVSVTADTVTFTREDFGALTRYAIVSGGNYSVALDNALALEAQASAYNRLIEAGKLQRQFTQIREDQLKQEKSNHFIDNIFHRGLIALGILAAL